jgi:hypothetical protein
MLNKVRLFLNAFELQWHCFDSIEFLDINGGVRRRLRDEHNAIKCTREYTHTQARTKEDRSIECMDERANQRNRSTTPILCLYSLKKNYALIFASRPLRQ